MPPTSGSYQAPMTAVRWAVDEHALTVTALRRTQTIPWATIHRAALLRFPTAGLDDIPQEILPGLDRLAQMNRYVTQATRQLAVAHGPRRQLLRVPIPLAEPQAVALADAVQARLGERWVGDVPIGEHYTALGVRYPWIWVPIVGIGLIAAFPLCILAMGAAGALSSPEEILEVPWVAWAALGVWGAVVYGLYWAYRRYLK